MGWGRSVFRLPAEGHAVDAIIDTIRCFAGEITLVTLGPLTNVAVAIDPTVATATKHLHVAIETKSELTRGATVVDHLGITGQEPNARVVLAASRERFLHVLYDAVQG